LKISRGRTCYRLEQGFEREIKERSKSGERRRMKRKGRDPKKEVSVANKTNYEGPQLPV
jgi:hypothetical protein